MPATNFELDDSKIIEAIAGCGVSPVAAELGSQLVENWARRFAHTDADLETVAVECGMVLWLDDRTLLIGVVDRIARDSQGVLGCEWKSTREPIGSAWNEKKWLAEITSGVQIATYALGLQRGEFYEEDGTRHQFLEPRPRILVRAAVKSTIPQFWPSDGKDTFGFSTEELDKVAACYLNLAASIRAMRATKLVPWQMTGKQCFNYNRECQFFKVCSKHENPKGGAVAKFDSANPAQGAALAHVDPERLAHPDTVILSASSYSDYMTCHELGRLREGGLFPKETNAALETGTALHAGLAQIYKGQRDWQRRKQ